MTVDPVPACQPRLTRLEVHGFKSFAARTAFVFEPGITAIVGPNGSGKSNVADAIRWVLGEQGGSALRAKRTEDVIFAGGQGRAPSGMAEATLVFDNADRWLPIDFAEVAVTRRADRTGDHQYLINGRRVRLKDVAQLTASLGQGHVVVGQGLVDAALSQRPAERRALFEHAADLAGLRLKGAEAERNLAEAEANSDRLRDLLTELEPRLKTLERAAKQAREWQGLRDTLHALQRTHYRGLLFAARARLDAADAGVAAAAGALEEARREGERLLRARDEAVAAAERARAALLVHQGRRGDLAERVRRLGHERDLAGERAAALLRRRQDMADTQRGLDEQAAAVAADLARLAPALGELDAEVVAARAALDAHRAAAKDARDRRAEQERLVAAVAGRRGERERRAADLARRRALLEQRLASDRAEAARSAQMLEDLAGRVAALAQELADAEGTVAADAEEVVRLDARLAALTEERDATRRGAAEGAAEVAALERRIGETRGRLDALRRLHESGAGLYAGVRAVLAAARAGELDGIVGTVAEVIEVPADLETAIEVALGGHLQDLVARRWADAERAIALLKRTGAGRATFQPIDTVRGGRSGRALPSPLRDHPDVRGVAADLVGGRAEVGGVVDALLGRTVVVGDLRTAKAILSELPPGWSAVTVGGEIARAGGSVTGGAAVRESGVLGRERELRALPVTLQTLETDREAARNRRAALDAEADRLADARRAVDAERAARAAAGGERRRQRDRLADWLDGLHRERAAAERRLGDLSERLAADETDLAGVVAAIGAAEADAAALDSETVTARAGLEQAAADAAAADAAAASAGQRLAALDERLRAERRREGMLRSQERAVAEELALRDERAGGLDRERARLVADHDRLAADANSAARSLAALDAERGPLEAAVRRAEDAATAQGRGFEAARDGALERERAVNARTIELERARAEVEGIVRRLADELDVDDPAAFLAEPNAAPPDPAGAEGREREIARLKERLRRIGYVGEDAVAEYEREAAHHAFLRTQLADVEGAAASLRDVLAELHRLMRLRFDATFARVAAAFAEAFAVLFGGGTARLVLAGGDGEEPGIDIVVQPPGKRLQSLALLSGGERALTAAALLFAILRVNPTPFCLLDEVDAALDEANVVRFREQLRSLADQTQVIVVTHNRGTIETADTLYGVSMGADGVSQVLSLRLAEAVPAD